MKGKTCFVLFLCFLCSITVLFAAGQKDDSGTIEFWNYFTGPDGENMNKLINDFNATNPAYKINGVTMASGELYQKIPTVVNSGKGVPDLCLSHLSRIPMFQAQGLLEPVTPILNQHPGINKANYRDAVWEAGVFNGVKYSIPLDVAVTSLIYNKDLVAKYAPTVLNDNVVTVDELMAIIPKAKADGLITLPVSFFTYEIATSLAAQEGSYIFKQDGITPNINSPALIKAYKTLRQIQEAGGGSEDGDDNLQLFIAGMSIFCHTGIWDANALNQAPNLKWASTNSLAYTPAKAVNYAHSNQLVLLKSAERTPEKLKVIADFIEFIRINTLEWARSGMIPASRGADNEPEFRGMGQYFFVSTPELEKTIAFQCYRYGGIAEDAIWSSHMDAIWGRRSVEDVLNQAQKQAEDNIAQQR